MLDQPVTAAAQNITIISTGAVTQMQPLTSNSLLLLGAGGAYTLTNTSNSVGIISASTGSVNFVDGAALAVDIGGALSQYPGIFATGAVTLGASGAGTLSLNQPIITAGGAVTLNAPTALGANVTIDTTNAATVPAGAAVTFNGTLDDHTARTDTLAVTAGNGTITFVARVGKDGAGAGKSPAGVTLTTGGDVDFTMVPGANNDGFTAGAITITAANFNAASYVYTKGTTTLPQTGNGGPINITTTGNVAIAGAIDTQGGFNTSTLVGGNAGSITISAGGSVIVGTGQTLTTTGSGQTLVSTDSSVFAGGFDEVATGSTACAACTTGNGGTVSITGASIDILYGAYSRGGVDEIAGGTNRGGNAAPMTLTATAGVVVGVPDRPQRHRQCCGPQRDRRQCAERARRQRRQHNRHRRDHFDCENPHRRRLDHRDRPAGRERRQCHACRHGFERRRRHLLRQFRSRQHLDHELHDDQHARRPPGCEPGRRQPVRLYRR